MAERVTIMRIDTNEVKELIAAAYHVDAKSIKFWNGKYEFEAKEAGNEPGNHTDS